MSESPTGKVRCESCGRNYPWKEALAGKKVRCKCGESFRVPEHAPPPPRKNEESAWLGDVFARELAASREVSASASGRRCPACGAALSHDAILCVQCGYDLRSGKRRRPTFLTENEAQSPFAAPPAAAMTPGYAGGDGGVLKKGASGRRAGSGGSAGKANAVAAMVVGLISFFPCTFLAIILGPVAFYLARSAEMDDAGGAMTTIARIMATLGLVFWVLGMMRLCFGVMHGMQQTGY